MVVLKAFQTVSLNKSYFFIEDENVHPNYPTLPQVNAHFLSKLEILTMMIRGAIPVNKLNNRNIDKIHPSQSMVSEKINCEK